MVDDIQPSKKLVFEWKFHVVLPYSIIEHNETNRMFPKIENYDSWRIILRNTDSIPSVEHCVGHST
jgi:hypothetical protein